MIKIGEESKECVDMKLQCRKTNSKLKTNNVSHKAKNEQNFGQLAMNDLTQIVNETIFVPVHNV
jgi:hypothetical protein